MKTLLNTEVWEKSARLNEQSLSTMDFEKLQKDRMLGQLYSQVSDYYKTKIDNGTYYLSFGYIDIDNSEMAFAGIYEKESGEQIQ